MLFLVSVTSADRDTHSYNSNLEFGLSVLTVTHAKPLDSNMNVEIAIPSLFNTKKKKGENGTETQLGSSSSTRYT